MCGIIAIVSSSTPAAPSLFTRLPNVSHRGYDSAGIAVMRPNGPIERFRRVGSPEALAEKAAAENWSPTGTVGIAHTRWATHGPRTEENAHPHLSRHGNVAVVHNGTLSNDVELREKLAALGVHPTSQTDSVLIAEYLEYLLDTQSLPVDPRAQPDRHLQVIRSVVATLKGTFALAVLFAGDQAIYLACQDMPLGFCPFGDGFLVGSEPQALAGDGNAMRFLEDGEVLALSSGMDPQAETLATAPSGNSRRIASIPEPSAKTPHPFRTWLEQEIRGQAKTIPEAVSAAMANGGIAGRIAEQKPEGSHEYAGTGRHVAFIGCGSSFHAGQFAAAVGRAGGLNASAHLAGDMDWASIPRDAMTVAISQSGETFDLLEELRQGGTGHVVALVNNGSSALARMAHVRLPLGIGRERSVASTKAFLAQAILGALAVGGPDADSLANAFSSPDLLDATIAMAESSAKIAAQRLVQAQSAYYLGTGLLGPIAREGALKIKEVAYLHAEAAATGELKHGPFALIGPAVPTVALLPHIAQGAQLERAGLALLEIQNRGGDTIVVGPEMSVGAIKDRRPTFTIPLPDHATPAVTALAAVIPLQLMALFVAEMLGRDVDRPRNLAKTVTVA